MTCTALGHFPKRLPIQHLKALNNLAKEAMMMIIIKQYEAMNISLSLSLTHTHTHTHTQRHTYTQPLDHLLHVT